MKLRRLKFAEGFRVIPGRRHRGADQWLYVVEGSGSARVDGKRYRPGAGSLLFIARGERHEIRNPGRK